MDLAARSVEVIEAAQDPSGALKAATGYPAYRYSWIRDGAFIADALDRAGQLDRAAAFHGWVGRTVLRYRDRVEALDAGVPLALGDEDILHPRFAFDGSEVPGHWSNFQLDCYGFWLSSLARHVRTRELPGDVLEAVRLVVRYLSAVWDQPSADCWEEHEGERHPTSLCAAAAGLRAAGGLLRDSSSQQLASDITGWVLRHGTAEGSLTKVVDGDEVDGSALLVLGPYGPFQPNDAVVTATLARVEEALVVEGGGVHRYLRDGFYGGGPWVPLAGALAWIHVLRGDRDRAEAPLAWIEETADPDGRLPEQTGHPLRVPQLLEPWERRWGPVARPLLWSHAMYLIARDAFDGAA